MLQGLSLSGVQVTCVCEDDLPLWQMLQTRGACQALLTAPDDHRQRHPPKPPAWRCLPRIEVSVGVKPDQRGVGVCTLKTGQDTDGRATVPADADRSLAALHPPPDHNPQTPAP